MISDICEVSISAWLKLSSHIDQSIVVMDQMNHFFKALVDAHGQPWNDDECW